MSFMLLMIAIANLTKNRSQTKVLLITRVCMVMLVLFAFMHNGICTVNRYNQIIIPR